MQSDDFFFRKFKRNNPRPLLSAVNFEPKAPRPAPEPAGTTVRARISEWPPRRELPDDGTAGARGVEEREAPGPGNGAQAEEGEPGPMGAGRGRSPTVQRSNSELTIAESGQGPEPRAPHPGTGPGLHREYGSASSIERPRGGEGRPGSARFQDPYLLLGLSEEAPPHPPAAGTAAAQERGAPPPPPPTPRPRLPAETVGSPTDSSVFRKFRAQKSDPESPRSPPPQAAPGPGPGSGPGSGPDEAWASAKNLVHYDVQSILFDPRHARSNRDSAGRRRNIITGASAASQLPARAPSPGNGATVQGLAAGGPGPPPTTAATTEETQAQAQAPGPPNATDRGDGKDTRLVLSCPHFRNEVGGEMEPRGGSSQCPNTAVSVLEEPRESQPARQGTAAYYIEHADLGANYYRKYFSGKEHQNFFGTDESLGPLAVSLRREDKDKDSGSSSQYNYRIIVRTTELRTLRASILEESIPSSVRPGTQRGIPPKKLLEYVVPGLNVQCLRLASNSPKVPEMLLKLDEQGLTFQRKVGIMYCRAGQSTEEEMYNNETAGPEFDEFLDLLGQRVKLKGFEKYRAQLDNRTDSTGVHSLYTTYQEYEIMFHVSTMLPYTANNSQQLLRKRHIGNDIVTIVFQEPGADPFTPKTIRSHFQHVFLVVQAHNPCTESVSYSVAVTRSKGVPAFGPFFQKGATFPKSADFRDFLLAKAVNAENAAEMSEKFHAMATRTRQEYLQDLADNHVTAATLDSPSSKLAAIISLPGKRRDKAKGSRGPELHSAGALVWGVSARLAWASEGAACVLGISNVFVVLLDPKLRAVVLNCSCKDVIGWSLAAGTVTVYYERGQFVALRPQEDQPEDLSEIVHRLEIVTTGCETEELVLLRNNVQHLGFQANGEGIVTQVDRNSYAEKQGLKLNSRLIGICGTPVVLLSYEERNRRLRKASQVRITVIPPDSKGKPRMSFSELYRKSIKETERKGDRATEVGPGSPCLPLLRMSSLQENRSGVPYGDLCLTVQSNSLEKPAAQNHRSKEDPGLDSLRSAPPDVILAANPQHLLPSGKAEAGAGDAQADASQICSSAQTSSAEVHCPAASDPASPSCPQAGANPMSPSVQPNGILIPVDSHAEWQSLADIASYCDNLVQSLSTEVEGTAEEADSEENDDVTAVNRLSKSPTALKEKVVHLETIVKQLHKKLLKEKEDKEQLETEVQQLRENNQRLHQESQTTVCHLLKVTELLCRTAPKPT